MPSIHVLSQSLINKIAAGEVIERPASVVKELVENAADAGATRIDVAIQAGGVELVRVADNGSGIPAGELELAVAAHATSKLAEADDLFRVRTLGFRGEALASIGEISRLVLRSRTADSAGGAQIEVCGGQRTPVAPCGCPPGTTVEVCNLFFNTPVRRKFLRATPTELGHVSQALVRVALALPQVHFTLRHNDRAVFELPGTQGLRERVAAFYGRDLADGLIWVESSDGPVRLSGYVAHPQHSRANNQMQYLFLNGRSIHDRALQHALGEAYRGLMMTGRFPIAFLALEMPPEMVDVNVHPTKLEVRFQDSGRLYAQVLSTLRNKFLASDLRTEVRMPSGTEDPTGAHDDAGALERRQELIDWAKGKVSAWHAPGGAGSPAGGRDWSTGEASGTRTGTPHGPLELTRLDRPWAPVGGEASEADEEEPRAMGTGGASGTRYGAGDARTGEASGTQSAQALQVHNRYLVAESEDGVVVIDQHALHERILYEQLRQRIEAGPIETQSLLVPEPVDLGPAEAAAVVENQELLARLGLKIEPFGGDTVLVAGYPAMLANIQPAEVLHAVVERLLAGGRAPERRDLLDELLHSIACKAAVRAGDRLAPAEITALLQQRHLIDDAHHCPHGRPTALVFTREELDKQFKRL